MSKKLIAVVIPRSKWYRGKGVGSALLCGPEALEEVKQTRVSIREAILAVPEEADSEKKQLAALKGPVIGQMCCLGHACKALGVKNADMRDIGVPSHVVFYGTVPFRSHDALRRLCVVEKHAVEVNDDPNISPAKRESRIKKILRKAGFKVRFID